MINQRRRAAAARRDREALVEEQDERDEEYLGGDGEDENLSIFMPAPNFPPPPRYFSSKENLC